MFDKKRFYFFRLIFSTVSIVKKGKNTFPFLRTLLELQ